MSDVKTDDADPAGPPAGSEFVTAADRKRFVVERASRRPVKAYGSLSGQRPSLTTLTRAEEARQVLA